MSKTPFMPLWVADFVGDTLDLDAKEIGAYMLLLMTMWSRGGTLPSEQKKLQRVARCGRDWPKVWAAIERYFTIDGDEITQRRLSLELQKVASKRLVSSQSGALGGKAKSLKNKETPLANASVSLQQPEPYLYTEREVKKEIRRASAVIGSSDLDEFKAELRELDDTKIEAIVKHRKLKRASITGYSARLFKADSLACGLTLSEAVDVCISRNWITVKAEWLGNKNRALPPTSPPKMTMADHARNLTEELRETQYEPSRRNIITPAIAASNGVRDYRDDGDFI